MPQNVINLNALIARIKREAKKLKRAKGISHSAALEQLARASGFQSWYDLTQKASQVPTLSSEFIVAIDDEEFEEFEAGGPLPFVVDQNLPNELKHRWLTDTQPWNKSKPTPADFSLMGDLTFLRFTGATVPADIDQALDLIMQSSRWAPWFVWLRGVFFDIRDEKGTTKSAPYPQPTNTPLEEDEDIEENPVVVRMLEWFKERYKDPADGVPYDSGEGGYQYIHGGPYDPQDVLMDEFGEVPWRYIQTACRDLYLNVGPEWVKMKQY